MKDKLKTFFLNHGEKLGFGLIVVMALFVLWGTRWSPYEKSPDELLSKAEKAETTIQTSPWPDERRQELIPTKNIRDRADELRGGVDPSPYVFSTPVYTPIYQRSEPILPPKFLAPDSMIADASMVLIEIPPETDEALTVEGESESEAGDKEEEDDQSAVPEGLRTRDDRPAAGGVDGLEFDSTDCGIGLGAPSGGSSNSYGADFGCGGEFMEGEGYFGEGAETVSRNGEGYRLVAVRAVIDWAAQKREYARALHLPLSEAGREEPIIVDFIIQRQRAVSEDDPWSGEWETLDIKHSFDVLVKAIDTEADVVDVTVTNNIITEPLPRRVLGIWGKLATHPKITNFVLSPEEQRLEQMRIARLREFYDEVKKNQPEPLEVGGFGRFSIDVRRMQNEITQGNYSDSMESYSAEYAEDVRGFGASRGNAPEFGATRPGTAGGEPDLLTSARGRSPASGRLLLFRYFDFDVDPGAVYRYRVQLEYANPNFGKPIELLASPELAEGRTRKSDWSQPTPAVQVEPEAEYFLTGVEYESKARSDMAVMDLYKWNAPTGTMVNAPGRYAVGDEIGGIIKTPVVNPLDETYEGQEIKVNTGDVVIDFRDQDDFKIDGQLPDLGKVPRGVRFDEVLVMNSHGNLRTYDRFTRESQRAARKRWQKFTDDLGEEYKEAAAKALDSSELLEGYGEGGGEYGEGGEYGSSRRAPSSASARRRARRRGNSPLRSNRGEGGEGGGGGGACY